MTSDLITTDHPLSTAQQAVLHALQDTLLPASDDGRLPSAASTNLVGRLQAEEGDFLTVLPTIVDQFNADFANLDYDDRHALVTAFSEAQPDLFRALLFQVYACYYENEQVMTAIGMGAGPPFPRGNSIEAGDLSLLDPVIAGSQSYRKTQ